MKYEIILYWSNEDGAFVADVPELRGSAAETAQLGGKRWQTPRR
jgi:predicted RNase H-like HicB family nuclease